MSFYDNFMSLCIANDLTPSQAAVEIGLTRSAVTNWKNRGNTPTDIVLYKIADYFNISVDELLNGTNKEPSQALNIKNIIPVPSGKMDFYEIYKHLCDDIGKSPSRVAEEIGIHKGTVSVWKLKGTMPNGTTLLRIAEYFGVTTDVLLNGTEKEPSQALNIKNIIPVPSGKKVPIIGTIACGTPILAEQNIQGYVETDKAKNADFALICKGDSMTPKFEDGDIVLIHQQPEVENGQTAAVLIGDEATLKKVYLQANQLMLVAENSAYAPMVYSGAEIADAQVIGLVVGYIRWFI